MQIRQKEEVNGWERVECCPGIFYLRGNKRINKTRCINGTDRMPYV